MDDKLTDLEIRITHQEAAIEEINATLLKQHGIIESLTLDLISLRKQMRDLNTSNIADSSQETPPPHY